MQKSNPLRAITTRYQGYNFRSRLEARWAKFFDHLKIKWSYEPEGFDLGNGLRYLPDFWLADWKMWVEIKPDSIDDVTREKARRLVQHSGYPVYCTEGMPDRNGVIFYSHDGGAAVLECPAYAYFGEPDKERIVLGFGRVSPDHAQEGFSLHSTSYDAGLAALGADIRPGPFQDALYAARGARFEFGEKGGAV